VALRDHRRRADRARETVRRASPQLRGTLVNQPATRRAVAVDDSRNRAEPRVAIPSCARHAPCDRRA
jgi:hypothetical protein